MAEGVEITKPKILKTQRSRIVEPGPHLCFKSQMQTVKAEDLSIHPE